LVRVTEIRRLYRHDIATGIDLADHVDDFNTIRPHEALDWRRPLDDPTLKPRPPNSEQES
jgi:transposase InsO family protein